MNPIDMILWCPRCGVQHIDAPDKPGPHFQSVIQGGGWDNPPHKSHLCAGCGYIWRPADVPTNGVAEIKTKGKDDHEPIDPNYPAAVIAVGAAMVDMTTTVRSMDEWPVIATLWKDCVDERDRLRAALEQCVTDAPYSQTVGATNRIGQINEMACRALRKSTS